MMFRTAAHRLAVPLFALACLVPASAVAQTGEIALVLRVDGELPPPPGAQVFLDGQLMGSPDAAGTLTFDAAAGARRVRALLPGMLGARADVDVPDGQTVPLQLLLEAENGLAEAARVSVPEARRTKLAEQLLSFTLCFDEGGIPLQLASVLEAPFSDGGAMVGDLASLLSIDGAGCAATSDIRALTPFLASPLEIEIQPVGRDTLGRLVSGAVIVRPSNSLYNPSFETPEVTTGLSPSRSEVEEKWCCDQSEIVEAEGGIAPAHGVRMLKFIATRSDGPTGDIAATVGQLIDLRQHTEELRSSGVTVRSSVLVNRVAGSVDSRFRLIVGAYTGSPGSFTSATPAQAFTLAQIDTDDDPATWERIEAEVALSTIFRIDYAGIFVEAHENISQEQSGPEFAGHYADAFAAVLAVPEPGATPAAIAALCALAWLRARPRTKCRGARAGGARWPSRSGRYRTPVPPTAREPGSRS